MVHGWIYPSIYRNSNMDQKILKKKMKKVISKIELIQILCLQVLHDYMH